MANSAAPYRIDEEPSATPDARWARAERAEAAFRVGPSLTQTWERDTVGVVLAIRIVAKLGQPIVGGGPTGVSGNQLIEYRHVGLAPRGCGACHQRHCIVRVDEVEARPSAHRLVAPMRMWLSLATPVIRSVRLAIQISKPSPRSLRKLVRCHHSCCSSFRGAVLCWRRFTVVMAICFETRGGLRRQLKVRENTVVHAAESNYCLTSRV